MLSVGTLPTHVETCGHQLSSFSSILTTAVQAESDKPLLFSAKAMPTPEESSTDPGASPITNLIEMTLL